MEKQTKHIDDLFREELEGYRETPPANVWTSLEQRLPAPKEPDRRWLWYILLLLLLGTAGYFAYKTFSEDKTLDSKKKEHFKENNGAVKPAFDSVNHAAKTGAMRFDTKDNEAGGENNNIDNKTSSIGSEKYVGNTRNNFSGKPSATVDKAVAPNNRNGNTKYSVVAKEASKDENGRPPLTPSSGNATTTTTRRQDKTRLTGGDSSRSSTQVGNKRGSGNRSANSWVNNVTEEKSQTDHQKNTKTMFDRSDIQTTSGNSKGAAKASNSKENRLASSGQKQIDKKAGQNDKDYLVQEVPEDEEDMALADEKEENDVAYRNSRNKNTNKEEDIKNRLNYIPPEAFPSSSSGSASSLKNTGNNTNTRNTITQRNNNNDKPVDASIGNFTVDGQAGKNKPIEVSSIDQKGKGIAVAPARFGNKNNPTVTSNKFKKSGLKVDSDVPTDPDEQINITGEKENTTATADSKNSIKNLLAASPSSASAEEEKKEKQPSAGGRGGGGGGGATPPKNGSKFRFDLGVKGGFERGFADVTTNTFIFSPYMQWNISKDFSFVFQPGFRYNQVSSNNIADPATAYHNITASGIDSNHVITNDTAGNPFQIQRNYNYYNTYDSILVGNALKTRNYWEIELPIMLRYKIASNLAIFGGFSLMFGNLIEMEEKRTTYTNLTKKATLSYPNQFFNAPTPNIPAAGTYFNYGTPNIAQAASVDVNPATNPARLGLMFGLSYELQKSITIDLLYKQTVSDMKYVPNEQIRKIYTQPYFRVMVGFKLFNGEKPEVENKEGF